MPPIWGHLFLAEKEGFEPSMSYQPIHEFQSCAINRARRLLHALIYLFMFSNYDIIRYFCPDVKPFFANLQRFAPEVRKTGLTENFLDFALDNSGNRSIMKYRTKVRKRFKGKESGLKRNKAAPKGTTLFQDWKRKKEK